MDYEVTSPTGKKYRVTAPEGATQDQVMSYAQSQFGHLENVPRETAGAASRVHDAESGILSGMAGLAGLPVDTALNVYDLGKAATGYVQSKITGKSPSGIFDPTNRSNIPLSAQWNTDLLNKSPITETSVQHPEDTASRYLNAAGSVVPYLAAATPGTGLANTARATTAALTGSAATQLAKDKGAGPIGQIVAGLVGGMTPAAVESAANLASRTVSNIVKPITKSGQQEIAANILQDQATDPVKAAANLHAAQDIVPGSQQTTGAASQDLGLLSLEKGLRSRSPADFGERLSEQNSARQQALASLAGTPEGVKAMQTARDAQTGPMREGAFANALPADSTPILSKIDEILASPAGKRETVSKTMEWAKNLIGNETDPATLYEIRKDLQLAQRGKLQPSSPNAPAASVLALAKGQLGDVINSLDSTIENAAPGFKAYLDRYKQLSIPIDQAKILQEIQRRSQLQSMDPTTQAQFLGPANFGRAVDAAIIKNPGKLSPEQLNQLNAIRTDLQMGQAINSPLVKAPGSDTFQNLSIAQAIGGGPTAQHPMMKIISQPLQWIYKAGGTDPAVNEILTNAMLDPKLAATLLTKATPKSVQTFSEALKVKALSGALGTSAQLAATQSKWQENKDTQQEAQSAVKQ